MARQLGLARDEYSVEAFQLNHSFIGEPVALEGDRGNVYGVLAGCQIESARVVIWLRDAPQGQATHVLEPGELLWFSNSSNAVQIQETLDSILKRLERR